MSFRVCSRLIFFRDNFLQIQDKPRELDKGGNFSTDNIPAVLQNRATLVSRESDLKLAETTEKRYLNLLETGDTSRLVVDQKRNETEKARAAVNEAKENLKAAENTARQSNQGIEAARVNV